MLRIAVVTAHYPSSAEPTRGRPAYQTLRQLTRQCEVEVFYPHAAYPPFLKPRTRTYESFDHAYTLPGVTAHYYDYPVLPLVSRPFNGLVAGRALLPHVRRFNPDLVFSYCLYPDGYAGLTVARALSVPFAAMGVGSDVHSIQDSFSLKHTKTLLREADLLLAISGDLRERMISMGAPAARTRTVISGSDPDVFRVRDRQAARTQLGIDPSAEAVVFIGRMDLKKGLRELVDAAASLQPKRPNLHVYLVGDGSDAPLVESAIAAQNAGGFVHMIPGCDFDQVAVWMAVADLVTLPSYMEGCPNVILEALACGRPVVATNVGGIPEIMSDACGRLVPPRDSRALAQALDSVLDSQWDADSIAAHWSRSWSVVADELGDALRSIEPKAKLEQHVQ
jgi:teichuronic acid biosynthesis glycosyltransferase TuaC